MTHLAGVVVVTVVESMEVVVPHWCQTKGHIQQGSVGFRLIVSCYRLRTRWLTPGSPHATLSLTAEPPRTFGSS